MKLPYWLLCAGGVAVCAFAMGFAWWLESKGYEPCPMCLLQRGAMYACGAGFLLGAIHGLLTGANGPRGWARWLWSSGAALGALAGVGIAARHVWLQANPEQAGSCSGSLAFLAEIEGWIPAITSVLKGQVDCARIDAAWLGLSLPAWTLVAFVGLTLYALLTPLLSRTTSRP